MLFLKHLKLLAFIGLLCQSAFTQFPYQNFEIVESIPLETCLDNPEIRNTSEVWLELINGAINTIDIEQFYISNQAGEALEPIIQAIEAAADRDVKIRIIAESRMSKTYPETLEHLQSRENIEVRIITVFNQRGGVQHSKFFVIDREVVFLGSQNFDWRALDHIHEIGVKVRHREYARKMTELFEFDWQQSGMNQLIRSDAAEKKEWLTLDEKESQVVEFFASASPVGNIPPGFSADLPVIVELLDNAKSRVYVQLLSYSPSIRDGYFPDLDSALRRAADRGVDVRLLCSDWCQHKYEIPYLKELVQKEHLDVKLSTIPEWSGGYISYSRVEHCKFMVVDNDFSWIGTSNWKRNYFYESRNQAIVVNNFAVNQALTAIFLKSWEGPYAWRIDPKKDYRPKYYSEKD